MLTQLINSVKSNPHRTILVMVGIGASVVTIRKVWSKFKTKLNDRRVNNLAIWRLSENCEIDSKSFTSIIESLENLLTELEMQRFSNEICRGKYDLISSIINRLHSVCSDLQKYIRNDFCKVSIEEIARSIWSKKTNMVRPGTLSMLSDDSFISACDEFVAGQPSELTVATNFQHFLLYKTGIKAYERGEIYYRKSRAEFCLCDSERDFAAKIYSLRQAFDLIVANPNYSQRLITSGREVLAAILRSDKRDPNEFYIVFDRMISYISNEDNRDEVKEELRSRRVEHTNLWDVLFDLIILDAFEDLQKPPSSIMALVNNSFISRSMKESTINNLIWSLLKVKRTRLKVKDGFISHFYDISQIMTCSLTMGLLGGATKEFQEVCMGFKDGVFQFVMDIFNLNKVHYTSVEELAEDVYDLLMSQIDGLKDMIIEQN